MEKIKGVLEKVLEDLHQKSQANPVLQAWQEAVDAKTQKHSRPLGIQRKVLRVAVDSSAWLYEMNLHKQPLLEKLQANGLEINNITFRIGQVK